MVKETLNIKYGEAVGYKGSIQELFLDVYEPEEETCINKPAILFIHGGGFHSGDKGIGLFVKMATEFAKNGYVAFSINYRLKDDSVNDAELVLNNAVADAMTAMMWIKSNSDVYGINVGKIIVCGDSAGGAIAVNLCFKDPVSVGAAACIDLWGGMPRDDENNPFPFSGRIYKGKLNANVPPTLIIHGTEDDVVPISTSTDLEELLAAAGVYCMLYRLEDALHFPETYADEFIRIMVQFAKKL